VVVDTGANVIESYDYYPFGAERRSMINANQSAHLRFTGKELDNDLDLGLYYFGARYYDPEVGRFIGVDPLAEEYPGWSPYVYCFNNPLNYVDPNGMEVVGDSTQLAQIANSVNEENNTSDAVAVERVDVAAKTITVFGKTITLKKASTYFRLNVNGESSFNWEQNEITSALYDVIESTDIKFNVSITKTLGIRRNADLASGYGGGYLDSKKGGGDIYLSPIGSHRETLGVRFMHEAVGHGHPVTGIGYAGNATKVNMLYNGRYQKGHYGYHKRIGWKTTGLWNMFNVITP
jgi:RHS repeat-associated protein